MYVGECEQVEEQRKGNSKLHPSKKLLRWLKQKPTYDITFGDDDQINKGNLSSLVSGRHISLYRNPHSVIIQIPCKRNYWNGY